MKTDFDKEFDLLMTEEREIPEEVRRRLDDTYEIIQTQAKRKQRTSTWKRLTAAACALFISGGLLTNEQVRANISSFFGMQDQGIDKALVEGFGEDNDNAVTDQDVTVTLQHNFADANKIGMSFQLTFADSSLLTDSLNEISMDYRLKNGDGEYISEFIPDTKELKGEAGYVAGHKEDFLIVDRKEGIVQYDVVVESSKGNLPVLKDAVIEIESIKLFNEVRELQEIEGIWHLPFVNNNDVISTFDYVADDSQTGIEVVSAIASPTSLNMELIVERQELHSEGLFMKVIDELGVEYESEGYHVQEVGDQFNVNVNFPMSAYHNATNLRLVIENVGEVKLHKE